MNKHIGYLKTDFRGECSFIHKMASSSISNAITKQIVAFNFFIKNIKQGKNNRYVGVIWVQRFQNSSITIGDNCTFLSKETSNSLGLNHRCMISTNTPNAKIEIGNNCSMSGTTIGALQYIKLGNKVRCGANVMITDSDWHSDDPRSGGSADVIIEDNVWLGANSVVLKGVTIGKNSLIGANSVVVKNIPPNVVAAGNPCKVIKQLDVML